MTESSWREFDAVLFDWCGTLVAYPSIQDRMRPILATLGRSADDQTVETLSAAIRTAEEHPEVIEMDKGCDLSAENHAETKALIFDLAGLDPELAAALEQSYGNLATYEPYPEVVEVITDLTDRGVEVAIVSDFHVDLRPHFEELGVIERISGFAISFEVGAVKPARQMFEAALAYVNAGPERCLMVGDNPHPDAGATALGIATLLLPVVQTNRTPLLRRIPSLVFPGPLA